jgi:hypothetical protein
MNNDRSLVKKWVVVGAITGLLAAVIYPLMIFVSMPEHLLITLAAAFGPLLSIASLGLYHLLMVNRKTVTLQIATISNVIAGTIVNMMLIIQLAIRMGMRTYTNGETGQAGEEMMKWALRGVDKVQLGLDVSWDVYIALGTFFFAVNMLSHPRFGRIFGWIGIILSVPLLGFNLSSFPVPPADAGRFDFGPLVGLWYMAVGIQALRSLKWVDDALSPYFAEDSNGDLTQGKLEFDTD